MECVSVCVRWIVMATRVLAITMCVETGPRAVPLPKYSSFSTVGARWCPPTTTRSCSSAIEWPSPTGVYQTVGSLLHRLDRRTVASSLSKVLASKPPNVLLLLLSLLSPPPRSYTPSVTSYIHRTSKHRKIK